MKIEVDIYPPRKPNLIASAKVRLVFEDHFIVIDDFRILSNKASTIWVAPPSYAVPLGRAYEYRNTVEFDRILLAQISDCVLKTWENRKVS